MNTEMNHLDGSACQEVNLVRGASSCSNSCQQLPTCFRCTCALQSMPSVFTLVILTHSLFIIIIIIIVARGVGIRKFGVCFTELFARTCACKGISCPINQM
jgi:hypothetical protein